MIKEIKRSAVRKLLPRRELTSHKGQNGRVLVIGGSEVYHGAPLLCAMGAMNSGVDLVYLWGPRVHRDVWRASCSDLIVKSFAGNNLSDEDVEEILAFSREKVDAMVIGPGLSKDEETMERVRKIVEAANVPMVLDADAMHVLKKVKKFPLLPEVVITPHRREFQYLVDREVEVAEKDTKSVILLRSISMDLHINVLLKGPTDYVSSHEGFVEKNLTGNPGMTVGGSGDVLSGVVGSFLARNISAYDAARIGAFVTGMAGDMCFKQKGSNFLASDIAKALPYAVNKL